MFLGAVVRPDGAIDGSEVAEGAGARAVMAASGAAWRPLAADESAEVMEGVRAQIAAKRAQFSITGHTRDWYDESFLKKCAEHPADWSKYVVGDGGVKTGRQERDVRLAETVDRMVKPAEFWKVFLPTASRKAVYKTK